MKTTVIVGLAFVLVLIGVFMFWKAVTKYNNPSITVIPTQVMNEQKNFRNKSVTLKEISQHASPTSCWMAIEGKVYDVSPFIASGTHEGGNNILEGCGRDATELYNNRPEDGRPHSSKAREMLKQYYIGKLSTD